MLLISLTFHPPPRFYVLRRRSLLCVFLKGSREDQNIIMPLGRLKVLLIGAKGFNNSDFLDNVDPYVILTCRTQEQRSSIASRQGTTPEWNETFVFMISGGVTELGLKIMDKDTFSSDNSLSEAIIDLEPLFEKGSLPATTYNVIKDQEYRGQIRDSLVFIPEECYCRGLTPEESYGGWKQSSFD